MNTPQILRTIGDITEKMVEEQKAILGHALAQARKGRYASALQASKDLGIGQSTYLSYENGQRQQVLAWWLIAINKVFAPRFGVDASYLLGLTPAEPRQEAPVWLLSKIAPHIKNSDDVLQLSITDESMAPNLGSGDIAVFEKADTVSQGGIYAIEYPNGETLARWVVPSAVGGWHIKDASGTLESLDDQALALLNVKGKYLFRITK